MPLTCLAIAACLLGAAPASPKSPAPKPENARAQIAAYLGSHDVATAAELRRLHAAPERPLMDIAVDGKVDGLIRARAVAALRLLPSSATHDFLGRLVSDKALSKEAADRLVVRRAAIALGWLAGPETDTKLAALFGNEDPEVRLDAAIGLGLSRAANAPIFLRRQLAVEQVPRVRQQIERQLQALGQPPPAPEKAPRTREQTPMRGGL